MQFDTIRRDDRPNYNEIRETRALPKTSQECPECKDRGIVKEKNGSVHTCWKCLENGKLDVHSKNIPDNDQVKL